jgi:hypothetical protein
MNFMGFSNYLYDEYFSHHISVLTENNLPELENLENEKLVQTYFLLRILHEDEMVKENQAIVFYYLRRTQLIITEYREAKAALELFINSKDNRILPYLTALSKLELVISYLHQIIELEKKTIGYKLFQKADNGTIERLNRCFNRIKHLEKATDPAEFVLCTFLTNNSFNTHDTSINYLEIKQLIVETARLGNKLAAGIRIE